MKFVTLVIAAMILSISASAQPSANAAEKGTVAKIQQKKKNPKAKSSAPKATEAKNAGVTTLTDESTYKAKWNFEQMLARKLEVEAKEAEKKER